MYKKIPPVLVTLPAGLYESIEDFINELNEALMSKETVMELYYNKASKTSRAQTITKIH